MATHAAPSAQNARYYVPQPTPWPFILTVGLIGITAGFSSFLEAGELGEIPLIAGAAIVIYIAFRWFRAVALESESGKYSAQVDMTYRWSMAWFIFSEVMLFAAFFGALFYARELSVPRLGGSGGHVMTHYGLWDAFEPIWPTNGPAQLGGDFETIPAWGLPFANTCLLLTSGVTITLSHHALKAGHRLLSILWLWVTVALGCAFLYFQAHEYLEAYRELNLTLHSGIYGSTFFMLTGLHGFHVTLGTLMLAIIALRLMFGHFTPESHFGFEGVAWYWHFVDVVWVGLFIFVYVL